MKKPDYCANHGTAEQPRWYFHPKTADIKTHGWKCQRIKDEFGRPVDDTALAWAICAAASDIYKRWAKGDTSVNALWIDANGHVRPPTGKVRVSSNAAEVALPDADPLTLKYPLGTCGSIITDYRASEFYPTNPESRSHYDSNARAGLRMWGLRKWTEVTTREARNAYLKIMKDYPVGGRRLAAFMCLALNTTRHLYDNPRHPNRVVQDQRNLKPGQLHTEANPFSDLRLPDPEESSRHPWPIDWIAPFVAHCDANGFPSLGDAVLFDSWLGQRLTDVITWPATYFDIDRELTFRQSKTSKRVILEWQQEEVLVARYHDSQRRRAAMIARAGQPTASCKGRTPSRFVVPTTFIYDDTSGAPFHVLNRRVNKVFGPLRDSFAAITDPVRVDWACEHYEEDPMLYDPTTIVLGALRHTAVTQLGRAGVDEYDISCITGHSRATVTQMLERYLKATLAGARRAFAKRRAFEATEQPMPRPRLKLAR